MNLGQLGDGVSAEVQLLVLGNNNKQEENTEEVEATRVSTIAMVKARVTLE